jgi:hypothetical protein
MDALPVEATLVEAMAGEVVTAGVAAAISGRPNLIKTGISTLLFPKFFRFIPVWLTQQFGIT